ncbi:winged helix-turn-helix transcriptional regulator [Actinomadura graeca]|uniref:Winged helix-turn-helix transcriptional regulator n=1 Tax=Actinomadura graeca TaxID=2750812 RepID=A0ABX8QZB7_9ACTN|nr:MarR family winged helix-turn-helix transcriptional regulator [Actinomadura graeca]QXJ24013.1 winged helix-turn-helix transcriptional regulator [Actinomadura graeca]
MTDVEPPPGSPDGTPDGTPPPPGPSGAPHAALPGTLTFQLVTLGALATDRFAEALAPLGLKPKHAGLLAVVSRGLAASQLDVAATMGVVPSLVVSLADHLVRLGAIERVRDPRDRRRQVLTLTGEGRRLLAQCAAAARSVDDQIAAALPPGERAVVARTLGTLADGSGLTAG